MMYNIREPTEQLNHQDIVRLTGQPNFKNQLSFFCHFEKITKTEDEKKFILID